jgi:hypothetical protein
MQASRKPRPSDRAIRPPLDLSAPIDPAFTRRHPVNCSVRRNRSRRCTHPLPEASTAIAAAGPTLKILLSLMLLGGSGLAGAQAVHRCVDPQGNISVQDRACTSPAEARSTLPQYAPVAPEQQRLVERQQRDRQAATADNLRVLQLLQRSGESEAYQHQENRRRCENARDIAVLCGKSLEGFSCDEKGFRQRHRLAGDLAGNNGDSRSAEQCVLRATMGGP